MKSPREETRLDELLSAYIDGMLSPQERTRLEARLTAEPALRERLEALQQTVALLRQLPQVPAPRNFILTPAMVRSPQATPARRPLRWLAPALSLAATASAVLSVVVLVTSLVAAKQATPTVALLEAEGDALEVAETQVTEVTALPEAAWFPPEEDEEYNAVPPVLEEERQFDVLPPLPPAGAVASEGVLTETAALSEPVGVGGGLPPTATLLATPTPPVALALPVDAATEAPLALGAPEPAPGAEERGGGDLYPPDTGEPVPAPQLPTMPWLPLSGLGSLTIALAIASLLAWRARRS